MEIRFSEYLERVRAARPLVHHITNYVTVNDCANICICAGGSPVMTDGEDVADMVSIASASVLNIGTLNERTVHSMEVAASVAAGRIPFLLDPVGAGATQYRTDVSEMLMRFHPTVIKGNAGEIGVLSGIGGDVKGVDSHGSSDAEAAVRAAPAGVTSWPSPLRSPHSTLPQRSLRRTVAGRGPSSPRLWMRCSPWTAGLWIPRRGG